MDFHSALGALRTVIKERPDAILVNEGANTLDLARGVIDMYQPRKRLDVGTWGVMGIGMGFAVAAAVETGKPVLAVEGDSAFGFSGMEVETICRYNLPVCIVVFNNNGIYRGTDVNPTGGSDVATTVFVKDARYDKMMEAFGGVGVHVTTPDELSRAVNTAMDSGRPTLINAVIDPAAGTESGSIGKLNPQSVGSQEVTHIAFRGPHRWARHWTAFASSISLMFSRVRPAPSCWRGWAPTSSRWNGPARGTSPAASCATFPEWTASTSRCSTGTSARLPSTPSMRRARQILEALVKTCDVLVENFAPGALERMGFTWERIQELNPRMIVASVKGFGPGPYEDCKVYENVAQCAGGAASTTGFDDGPPLVTGAQIGDSGTGLHLALGIVSALYQRHATGRGQRVFAAMQDGVLNLSRVKLRDQQRLARTKVLEEYPQFPHGHFGDAVPRAGNASGGGQPGWIVKCKGWETDPNAYIYVITQAPVWAAICTVIGHEEWLTDPRYANPKARLPHLKDIFGKIEEWTKTKTKFEAMDTSTRTTFRAARFSR